jgi:hypothetical protein
MQETHGTLTVRIPVGLKDAFIQAANKDNTSASRLLLHFMQDYVDRHDATAPLAFAGDAERLAREQALREARASLALEGFTPSDYADALGRQYAEGAITAREQVSLLRKHYGLDGNTGVCN